MTIAPAASTTSPARARAAAWSSGVSATIAIRSPSTSTPPGASASPASGRTSRPSAMKTLDATVDEAIGDPVGDRGADSARAEPVEAGHREDGGGFHLEVEHAGPAQV